MNKKPLWICNKCKFANFYNKTVCYNCANINKKRAIKIAEEQMKLGLK